MSSIFIQTFPDRFPRVHRWGGRLLTVFVGQGIIQALNFVVAFLVIRWMSMDSYALFGIVFGFQSTLGALVDLGFSGCIISLVGNRGEQRAVVGGYIAGARWFRTRLFAVIIPFSGAAFFWIGSKHGWSLESMALLFGCIVVALYSQGRISWYSAPLLIHHRIAPFYRIQSLTALARLAASFVLYLAGMLSAFALTVVNTITLAWTAVVYSRQAHDLVAVPEHADPHVRREMLHYLMPLLPGIIFTALQGQLVVLLISIFGRTQNIAEVAALGRLGQLFVLLAAVNSTLVEPYFARLHHDQLFKRYLQVVGAAFLFAIVIATICFLYPGLFLWILGSKYEHLDRELGWMMATASLGYVSSVMWTIHSARKWVYWWGSFLYIGVVTAVQAIFIATRELNTTLSVLYLGFVTSLAVLFIHTVTALICLPSRHKGHHPAVSRASTHEK